MQWKSVPWVLGGIDVGWCSDVTNLRNKVVELLLGGIVLCVHLLVLGFPLVAGGLQGLHLALVVAGLDVGLAKPADTMLVSC